MSVQLSTTHYNPDWLSDDELIANFIVRKDEFTFLQDELRRSPLIGSVQHYILIGLRGAGKTTLLKRIAVAIRRNPLLSDHLIAISFPEELYQVKNLADFWWAACESLADELDYIGEAKDSKNLLAELKALKKSSDSGDSLSDAGFSLLQRTCKVLSRRAVLLVDNLDMIFQRIDKSGRKLNDPFSPAYWAMREALSTSTSPIVIGGSVRLSEPFTDYDKAFYDFFIPKRLGRLNLEQVRQVLERLADVQNEPELKERLNNRPSRLEALHDLTGGNPRALGLIFELLRIGPNSRAIEDFKRLMDITTPYYKARFEDISEQAQVVMHALAVRPFDADKSLRFGHTASELADHAGLPTSTVSAQLKALETEGLVEKSKTSNRTQYRIAEQLFRLWLQMRGSRRIRQNVIGLTDFLEAMYDSEELHLNFSAHTGGHLAEAQFAFAIAGAQSTATMKKSFEVYGTDRVFKLLESAGGEIGDYLPAGDLSDDLEFVTRMREHLRISNGGGLSVEAQDALLGSLNLTQQEKELLIQNLLSETINPEALRNIQELIEKEQKFLIACGMLPDDMPLLFSKRARGYLTLPKLSPDEVEASELSEVDKPKLRSTIWRLLGAYNYVALDDDKIAGDWLFWGKSYLADSNPNEWARVAGAMRRAKQPSLAHQALMHADDVSPSARSYYEKGQNSIKVENYVEAEKFFRLSLSLNSEDHSPWLALARVLSKDKARTKEAIKIYNQIIKKFPENTTAHYNLAIVLAKDKHAYKEAVTLFQKTVELDPKHKSAWINLAFTLAMHIEDFEAAEIAVKNALKLSPDSIKAIRCYAYILSNDKNRIDECIKVHQTLSELDPDEKTSWVALGLLLSEYTDRQEEAAEYLRIALKIDPNDLKILNSLAQIIIDHLSDYSEAEVYLRKILNLDPKNDIAWNNLGLVLSEDPEKSEEAELAFRESIKYDPTGWISWSNLGSFFLGVGKRTESEEAFRRALLLDDQQAITWFNLANLLVEQPETLEEAMNAYCRAIERDPTEAMFWNNYGNTLEKTPGKENEAITAYRKAAELDPVNPIPFVNLGHAYKKEHNEKESEAYYKKAIELDSNYASAWGALGSLLLDIPERLSEAEESLNKAVELDPLSPMPWNTLGILKVKQELYVEAAEFYEKSISVNPNYDAAWLNYGHLLTIHLDRPEEAIVAYGRAVELNPNESSAWNNLGIHLSSIPGRQVEAESASRTAISIEPRLALPWHNLFNFLISQGRSSEASSLVLESRKHSVPFDEGWEGFYLESSIQLATPKINSFLESGDFVAAHTILDDLIRSSKNITAMAVSPNFVEGFLSALLYNESIANYVLKIMRDANLEVSAKPLLLAFEAAINSNPTALGELEPELQGAAKHMYSRLTEVKTKSK